MNKMKIYLALIVFIVVNNFAFSQQNYRDVVYLNNGSISSGVKINQVPNKSIKLDTADFSAYFDQMVEIEKTSKIRIEMNNLTQMRKGYIGLSLGVSIPMGSFVEDPNNGAHPGLQLRLVNFGYLFTDHFGITATLFAALNHAVNTDEISGLWDEGHWVYGGLMAGPLLSYPISKKVDWDFRPMIGFSFTLPPYLDLLDQISPNFAFNVGTVFRYNLTNKFSLLMSADYFSTKPVGYGFGLEPKIGTISFGLGCALRLK